MPRFYCPVPLTENSALDLPAAAARHVQVLRLQPGDVVTLFDGTASGGEFAAQIAHMGRHSVQVLVGARQAATREATRRVCLAVGMPANERMDWLVEKATELGVAHIQPLHTERSVLRLSGERARKKVAHWQSVAVAACEQCGGNQVPLVAEVQSLADWLQTPPPGAAWLLSLHARARPLRAVLGEASAQHACTLLSGPEGGLSASEEAAALAQGYAPVSLGPRVLRAETAALAALAALLV